jgi:endonuclease G, mitochondrial
MCRSALVASVCLSLLVASCASPQPSLRLARHSAFTVREAGFTPQEVEWIADNCPLGMPTKDPDWEHGPAVVVAREGYALEHSSLDKVPLWVCERITPEELRPGATRRNRFAPDPKLDGHPRAELQDYKRSGYDRGHQAPAGNQNASQQLKDETFFLSNMAPQEGAFNQQVWREIEDLVRGWVEDGTVETAWAITGGFFFDPREEDPATADGFVEYFQIGQGAVAVPTHFYKIVALREEAEGEEEGGWRTVAFVLENRKYPRPYDFQSYLRPVRWIEERTGLDFLPELDPLEAEAVEAAVGTFPG